MTEKTVSVSELLETLNRLRLWDSNATTSVLGNKSLSVSEAIEAVRMYQRRGIKRLVRDGSFLKPEGE